MRLYNRLFPRRKGARLWILLDPDSQSPAILKAVAAEAAGRGADALLVGGSFLVRDGFDAVVKFLKNATSLPLIIFPGGSGQLSRYADGILFTSLLSGRNPQYLIGEQVKAAPLIRQLQLEAISTAYLLIDSGRATAAEFVSDTRPIPRDKPKLAVAHALAAELFGMQAVYLEAGSGGAQPVPREMIAAVAKNVSLPVIVGGGIVEPAVAREAARAGARVIVIGTAVEKHGVDIINRMAAAIKRTPG